MLLLVICDKSEYSKNRSNLCEGENTKVLIHSAAFQSSPVQSHTLLAFEGFHWSDEIGSNAAFSHLWLQCFVRSNLMWFKPECDESEYTKHWSNLCVGENTKILKVKKYEKHHGAVPRNPCAAPRNPMAPRVEVPGDKTKTQKC